MTIRRLVADDQGLVGTGFRMVLEAREDLHVVGEAATARRPWRWRRRPVLTYRSNILPVCMGDGRLPQQHQVWIEARRRFRLSAAQVQMARELAMNPRKFGKLANHGQEPWKLSLPQFIESLYFKRFGRDRPTVVLTVEEQARQQERRKAARKAARKRAREESKAQEDAHAVVDPAITRPLS